MIGSWNWLDWILAAIMLVSLLAGARKGFVRELIGLASLVAGLVVAAAEYQRAAAWLGRFIHSEELALGVAFLSLFGGVVIAGAMISAVVRKLVREAGIEWVDRLLGAVFGLVRGVVLDAVVLMTLVAFAIKTDAVQRSRLTPYVGVGSQGIARVMPADLRARFQSRFAEFERELVENERRAFEKASPER
jgi:membrane protein required for colicin V production